MIICESINSSDIILSTYLTGQQQISFQTFQPSIINIDFDSFQMSHSKSKTRSILQPNNNQAKLQKNGIKPSVHIFPHNSQHQQINKLTQQLDKLHIISVVRQKYTEIETIICNAGQYTKKQICLIQLQDQELGSDCCFPKDYVFPSEMNIFIVFFSFKPIHSKRPYLLSMTEIVSFCEKELKPHKIKLKSIQNVRSDSRGKNSSTHSTQKQKLSTPSHSLISQFNSQQYELLFYFVCNQVELSLNQNEFNYQLLLRSVQKLQKCQPFGTFQQLLKKQIYKNQKKYIILSNLSAHLQKIILQTKKEQFSCFDIILYADMKPANFYMEKQIVLATGDSNLIFKFLKNHGFDSPELRQQHLRTSQRYSISSNDFRNQMDNLMNLTSQYSPNSTFLRSFGQQRQAKRKKIRHWLVEKDPSQSSKFLTKLVKVQQFEGSGSVFNKMRSFQKSNLSSSSNSKMLKIGYLSPKKKQSTLKIKQTNQEVETKELQLYSNIGGNSYIKQNNKNQLKPEKSKQGEIFREVKVHKNCQNNQQIKNRSKIKQNMGQGEKIVKKLGIVNNQIMIKLQNQQKINLNKQQNISQQLSQFSQVQSQPYQITNKQKITTAKFLLQQKVEQSEMLKQQSQTGLENGLETQYYSKFSNNKICNQKNMRTQNKNQSKTNRIYLRSNSNSKVSIHNPVNSHQNILKRVYMKSAQQKPITPQSRLKNIDNKNDEIKTPIRKQLQKKKELPLIQSLDLSNTLNTSNTSKNKYKYNFRVEKSKLNMYISGEDFIEQKKKKMKYMKIDICRFHFIIEKGLNYIKRILQKYITFPGDKVRTYQNVQQLYQILRLDQDYDLGFVFCLKRDTKLINIKLLPQRYFIVNIDNNKQSYLDISEENRKISLGSMEYFQTAQSILIEQKLQQYVLCRKNNTEAGVLVDKFKNSEFTIQANLTKFNVNLLDNYFNDYSRLTRLYFICNEVELPLILQIIKNYRTENTFFSPQSCNLICILQNEIKKYSQNSMEPYITYISKRNSLIEYKDLLDLLSQKSNTRQNKIEPQLIIHPTSLCVNELFNEEYPGRFEFIAFSTSQEAEKIASNKKSLNNNCQIYLLTSQRQIVISQVFDKIFILNKTKSTGDGAKTTVSNVLQLLQLLRF